MVFAEWLGQLRHQAAYRGAVLLPQYQFFCRGLRFLPHRHVLVARIIGRQFLRSGTYLAANYRAACRVRSAPDFISKISVVAEEADETLFWFELLVEAELIKVNLVRSLMKKCEELLKIFPASLATAKRNR